MKFVNSFPFAFALLLLMQTGASDVNANIEGDSDTASSLQETHIHGDNCCCGGCTSAAQSGNTVTGSTYNTLSLPF